MSNPTWPGNSGEQNPHGAWQPASPASPTGPPAGPPTGPPTGAYGAPPTGPTAAPWGSQHYDAPASGAQQYGTQQYGAQQQYGEAQPWGQSPLPKKKSAMLKWLVPLAVLVVAAVVVTFLVVGGDPGVKDGDRDITNAKAFASEQTSAWKDTLPKKGITKEDDAACYYVVNEESEEVTKRLACGPVRRPQTSTTEVWDVYAYTVTPGSKKDAATAGDPDEKPEKAQKLPSGSILVNGDGKEVDVDGADLKEPKIPTADKDALWESSSFTVDDADKVEDISIPGETTISGLATQYSVDSLVEYKAANLDDSITHPGKGQKFYVLTLSGGAASNDWIGTNTVSIKAGDNELEVPEPTKAPLTYLISAPDGGPLELLVDSDGKKQSLNLLTGERTGDPETAALYTDGQPKSVSPGTQLVIPRATGPDGSYYDITVTVDKVTATPYQDGWAESGQQFITIELSSTGSTSSTSGAYYRVDCTGSSINEGSVTCKPGSFGAATLTGTAAAGPSVTLNLAGSLIIGTSAYDSNGTPVPFTTTSASVPLPT